MLKTNESNYAIELKGIKKSFGKVIATENVNLNIQVAINKLKMRQLYRKLK